MKRIKSDKIVNVKQEPVKREDEDDEEEEDDDDDDDEEEEEDSDSDGDEDDNTLIVRIDRNILDCPVCHKPLKSSLFQVVASMDWPEVTEYQGLVSAQPHRHEMIKDLFTVLQDPQKGASNSGMIRQSVSERGISAPSDFCGRAEKVSYTIIPRCPWREQLRQIRASLELISQRDALMAIGKEIPLVKHRSLPPLPRG